MNTPNKYTIARLVLAPLIFLWFFSCDVIGNLSPVVYAVVLLPLFLFAEMTDLLDGLVARKRNLVTDLGKVMDPFGDVICHITYFICFLVSGYMPVLCFAVIVWREFSQSFIRMLLMGKGVAMPANIFGKAKTCFYAVTALFGFVLRCLEVNMVAEIWLYKTVVLLGIGSAFFAFVSFLIYMREVVKSKVLSSMTR